MTAQSGTPLAVLDLVPVTEGGTAAQALRNSIDLARQAERFGYARYWVAEHHLNAGVAGTSPAVVLGPIAAATTTIRVGSGAVQLGHRTALSTVEEFGLLDALYPGRVDLGLGRSGGTPPRRDPAQRSDKSSAEAATPREVNGVLIPKPFDTNRLLASPRVELQRELLLLPDAKPQDYAEQIDDLLALLRGDYRADDGRGVDVVPGAGADVQPWLMGSSGGQSARVAGQRGLRFAVAYHVAPAGVLDAVASYRAAFTPSTQLAEPYVAVSADVVLADDEHTARGLAAGYGPWVRSIRTGEGAIAYPTTETARSIELSAHDEELIADRVQTQFVGTAEQVVPKLRALRDLTEADELIITTITHRHADRVRSYELLAKAWGTR